MAALTEILGFVTLVFTGKIPRGFFHLKSFTRMKTLEAVFFFLGGVTGWKLWGNFEDI